MLGLRTPISLQIASLDPEPVNPNVRKLQVSIGKTNALIAIELLLLDKPK